jgi:DNA-directed RNA polymerase subunit N (RpoN/RPB10)
MTKIKIRCFKTLANVYPGIYNFPVYYLAYEGWSNYSLATCINCGELFAVDWENSKTKGLKIIELAASNRCPTCNASLSDTLRNYPQEIKLPNGKIGHYTPDTHIPPDEKSIIIEVFEISP